jgi:hypothetical protein
VARRLAAAVGAGFAAAAAWGAYASSVYEAPRLPPGYAGPLTRFTVYTHVDSHRQERLVLQHPLQFAHTIGRTLSAYWTGMLRETVAQVPLWSVPMSLVVVALAIVVSATVVPDLASPRVLGWRSRCLLVAIAATAFAALMALAYVGWNAVGSPRVEAFQGRYLLPLLPLGLVAAPVPTMRRAPGAARMGALLALASALVLVTVWFGLRSRFY